MQTSRPVTVAPARVVPLAATVALAIAVLTGCAAAPSSPLRNPGGDQTTVSVQSAEGTSDHIIRRDDFVALADVPAARTDVWRHLIEAWKDVGLSEPVADRRTFSLRVVDQLVVRRLGSTPLSSYLDCGSSISGWNADTHRVRITVHSLLEQVSAEATRVHTRLDAIAQSTGGASAAQIQCSSKGTLESLIARRVREKLGQPQDR